MPSTGLSITWLARPRCSSLTTASICSTSPFELSCGCSRLCRSCASWPPAGSRSETAEQVHLLAPLAVPRRGRSAAEAPLYPAVRLLIDRARTVLPDFDVTSARQSLSCAVSSTACAIELAAVRLRSLSVSQVVERLDRRFHRPATTTAVARVAIGSLRGLYRLESRPLHTGRASALGASGGVPGSGAGPGETVGKGVLRVRRSGRRPQATASPSTGS